MNMSDYEGCGRGLFHGTTIGFAL